MDRLVDQMKCGDMAARDQIIILLAPFARKWASWRTFNRQARRDCEAVALLTLVKAVDSYRTSSSEASIHRYVKKAIMGRLTDYRAKMPMINVSRKYFKKVSEELETTKWLPVVLNSTHLMGDDDVNIEELASVQPDDSFIAEDIISKIALSDTEKDILMLKLEGHNNVDIADMLNLSKVRIGQLLDRMAERYNEVTK